MLARDRGARARRAARVELVDLGEHRCATSLAPERVFQVGAPGLRPRVPAAAIARRVPGQPAAQVTSFVGRRRRSSPRSPRARRDAASSRSPASAVSARPGSRSRSRRRCSRVSPTARGSASSPPRPTRLAGAGRRRRRSASRRVRGSTLERSIVEFLRAKRPAARARQLRAPARRGEPARASRSCATARTCGSSRSSREGLGSRRRADRAPCGRCRCRAPTSTVAAIARATRCSCSPSVPRRHAPDSRSTRPTSARWSRSAAASTASRSPSSSRRRAWSAMNPSEIATPLDERFRLLTGGRRTGDRAPPDAARHRRLVVLAARADRAGRCSTASACSRAASTPARRRRRS